MSQMVFKYILFFLSIVMIIVLLHRVERISFNNETVISFKEFTPKFFTTWITCAELKFSKSKENAEQFWKNFKGKSQECDVEASVQRNMKIIPLRNQDEMKYAILPVQRASENVFVTLGIGQDISAEEAFLKEMKARNQNVTFYGADPIVEGNSKLYSRIGKFFPFAVGSKAGYSIASVLLDGDYKNVPVVHVDIYYFLSEVLRVKNVDYLWMDAEYAEYGVFDIFYRSSHLERKGITFCQMSLEVHNPSQEQKKQFMEFIKKLIEEKQFGFFFSENVGHMRMWLFNFGSHYCVQKFFE